MLTFLLILCFALLYAVATLRRDRAAWRRKCEAAWGAANDRRWREERTPDGYLKDWAWSESERN